MIHVQQAACLFGFLSFWQVPVVISQPPSASSSNATADAIPPAIRCSDTLTRFDRPHLADCANLLPYMPSDPTPQTFSPSQQLPFLAGGTCALRVLATPGILPLHSSWLYLQTAATQLMIGCLRVYENQVRTGGVIRVGIPGSFLDISMSKLRGNVLQDAGNVTLENVDSASQ